MKDLFTFEPSHAFVSDYTLPRGGTDRAEIERRLDEIAGADPDELHSRMSLYCMKGTEESQAILALAHNRFLHKNNIAAALMPGCLRLEQELLSMSVNLLNGGASGIVANMTSGGTESIFCAMHAAREWAKARHPRARARAPEFIAAYSAHPTFSKACHYLGLKVTRTAVRNDYRADPAAIEAAIGPDTIGLYASAPCWPYGLYDPIAELGEIAERHGLWLHVDACVGGFIAPFVRKLGYPIPDWDFSVPGVTSISADLHKYAYALKPASVIAWRSAELLQYHHFSPADWPSIRYETQGFVGSRPTGAVAAAWAVMHFLGEEGYLDYARQMMQAKERLVDGLRALGLRPWESELCILCYDAEDIGPEIIAGGMGELGWVHFGTLEPPLIQLILDPIEDECIERYLTDLAEVVRRIRAGEIDTAGRLSYTS